ncbi:MAG: TolC family protein [Candidatus Gastranaerophilales bacterium]|nr:TolC family protein [Candidatus Gastranaerophilales bacterium]
MKKLLSLILCIILFVSQTGVALAIQDKSKSTTTKPIVYAKNARTISYAFVFDGPSEKNKAFLEEFKKSIISNTAPNYKASFPSNLIFTGDWTQQGAKKVSDKALASNATMVVSLGYLSSKYFNTLTSKKKFVVTIDQYGLKDLNKGFFDPVQQVANGIEVFTRLVSFQKAAVLLTDSYYNTRSNWNEIGKKFFPDIDFVFIPVNNDAAQVLKDMPDNVDVVIFTPLYNLSVEKKKYLINTFNERKIPTYSTVGKEDVELGVLFGTGVMDADKKLADTTSFSIRGVLAGDRNFNSKVSFYEDQLLYTNKDTADLIGHKTHMRVLDTAEVITNKKPEVYSLSTVFNKLETSNLDIRRAGKTLTAARRASIAAILRYLPTFNITLGYQQYNEEYADSAKLLYPEKTGSFSFGIEQVIYSPELVTNILIKNKQVNFKKSEKLLTEQSMGIELAELYVDTLMLENMIKIQKEYVTESRENLAIARVREKMGKCGKEEALRWAAQLSTNEQKLVEMKASLKNIKIDINKVLSQDPNTQFELAELKANDPAFYTSEINLIDYLTTEDALETFTKMIIEESYRVSPELAKLKAAMSMKKYEMAMYYQKFVLPSAKLTYEYTTLIRPQYTGDLEIPLYTPDTGLTYNALPHADKTNGRFGIYAQWKPVEGGTKIAELARAKAELDELKLYDQEVREELDAKVRGIINTAIADYIVIEKKYKSMYAAKENYQLVKKSYLENNNVSIAQLTDAQKIYLDSKVDAMNSQYEFFKDLLWVQRALCSVNWVKASPDSRKFIQRIKDTIEKHGDVQLL